MSIAAGSSHRVTPGAGDAGTHVVQVWVRSAGSPASYEAWTTSGIFSITP